MSETATPQRRPWQRRPRTWVIGGAVVLVVAAAGVYGVGVLLPSATATEATTQTLTATASYETLEQSVEATGTLAPTSTASVSFGASGTVTAVAVAAGQTVTAGQTLATVDTLQANASLLSARAVLAKAEATLAASEDSSDGSDEALATIASNEAQLALAQQDVTDAEATVAATTLVAPIAGLVTAVDVEVGDAVTGSSGSSSSTGSTGGAGGAASGTGGATASGSGSTSGTSASTSATSSTAAFTIVGTDSWSVDVTVSETDVALIAAGDQVELATDDGDTLFGVVDSIGLLPATTTGSAAYPVAIRITGTPSGLFEGVSVTATTIYERRVDVLTVATAAITTADGVSSVTTVTTGDDGGESTASVTVETGETSGTTTEILSGLSAGDTVQYEVAVQSSTGGSGTGGTGGTGTDAGTGQQGGFGQQGGTGDFDPSQFTGGGGFDPSQSGGAPAGGFGG